MRNLNGSPIELPNLQKILIVLSGNVYLYINSPQLKSIIIYSSTNIEIRGNIHSVNQLYLAFSNYLSFEPIHSENKDIRITECENIFSIQGSKTIPFEMIDNFMNYDVFSQCCKHNIIFGKKRIDIEKVMKRFNMRSFFDNEKKKQYFYDENKQLVFTEKERSKRIQTIQSSSFCKNGYKEMKIMTKEGKKIISSDIRYFEVKTIGYNDLTIKLLNKEWSDGIFKIQPTEGVNIILNGMVEINNRTGKIITTPYILYDHDELLTVNENIIGCGYDMRKGNVFYTINGKKILEGKFINKRDKRHMKEEDSIDIIIQFKHISHIEINTGKRIPFVYDLEEEYEKKQ